MTRTRHESFGEAEVDQPLGRCQVVGVDAATAVSWPHPGRSVCDERT